MSSIGTGYDLAASTFSPDGRIFQVEYAAKAVESSVIVVALGCNKGVLVAVDQPVPSKLSYKDANTRIMDVNDHIGMVGSGLHPDLYSLLDYVRDEANAYLREYRQPVGIKKLATTVAERVHIFTLGISRPYGASFFLTAWDKKNGPSIYCIDPSGQCIKYYSWVIGKNAQAAKTEIEKLEQRAEMSKEQLIKKAIHIMLTVRDEGCTSQKIEMGWVGGDNDGVFTKLEPEVIDAAEKEVQDQMRMEEDD